MKRFVVQCRDKCGFGMWLVNAYSTSDAKRVVRAYTGIWVETYGLEVTWEDDRDIKVKKNFQFTIRGVLAGGSFFE